jgi:CRISPR system Cascade subunit CasA
MPSYRLDLEPWIPVQWKDGRNGEVSLADIFRQAPLIRRIQGTPLEVAVLHRLIFAIFHRAHPLESSSSWLQAWDDRSAPLESATQYVSERGKECFDLYHRDRPFMQHPRLLPGDKPVAVLQYERAQGNNPVFLDASQEGDQLTISSATAARALLVNMAFGGSHPDKSNPLSTGKEDTMYAGPLCARLVVILEGSTLDQTLLLNRIIGEPVGRPAWERPMPDHPTSTESEGIADRYSRTTRFIRLRLSESGQECRSVALHMGERIEEGDEPEDPMMPQYFAESDKKMKVQRLHADKALWRSSNVLLSMRPEDRKCRPARALAQFGELCAEYIDPPVGINLRVTGVAGNAQGPTTDIWRDECLPFCVAVRGDTDLAANIMAAIEFAETEAEALKKRLYSFAKRYMEAAVPNPDKKDVIRLSESLAPGLASYWAELAHDGERLGLGVTSKESWEEKVRIASKKTFEQAVEMLPVSGRRLQAQYGRASSADKGKAAAMKQKVNK